MYKFIATLTVAAAMAAAPAFAGQRLDPIFQVVGAQEGPPAQSCFTQDNRNIFVQGATSVIGQTIIGGLLGALLGDQIGSGDGNDIATGVGAAAGAAAGAWNAQRMEQDRIQRCQRYQSYVRNYDRGYGGGYGQAGTYQVSY
ncbi:MAG: glycine zipper 2TM domain-containing protein [Salinisphaera sp.]|nr:glycine zipper 2TM domain-containing protein [Salinisphaera sp.]MDN5937255.1 glycine zipper 2TM domain-containing protein [Salinisphaera sp.]